MQPTVIKDNDSKIDILDHLNLEHKKELLAIAQVYLDQAIVHVSALDLFEEGILLQTDKGGADFVPFLIDGDLHHKIRQLAMTAVKKQGKNDVKSPWLFKVEQIQFVTANLCRLTLKTPHKILSLEAGYAWRFSLEGFATPLSEQEYAQRAKELPSRYYTMRKCLTTSEQGESLVWVDVFLHNDSKGSCWAKQLKIGEYIYAYQDYYEYTQHLAQGENILIADETGFPTLAAILENWQNPMAPRVISISHQPVEQDYLAQNKLHCNFSLYQINQQNAAQQIIQILDQLPQIDNVWGALESSQAKQIRIYLRHRWGLKAEQNRIKGYWKKTP